MKSQKFRYNPEQYAICSEVRPGIFSTDRMVRVGLEKEFLNVENCCLGLTQDGFIAAQFYIEKIEKGFALGYVANRMSGAPNARRRVQLDSLTESSRVFNYDGRLQNIKSS